MCLDGKPLVHSLQIQYIHQVIQTRLVDNPNPLTEVYRCLHFFCQSLQLEVLYSQTLRLIRDRLDDHIHVDEYTPGQRLTVSYWRELTTKDARSELGYRLTVQVDAHESARPLAVLHVPALAVRDSELADRAIRSPHLSVERLLVHTIYVRTRARLQELRAELATLLRGVECSVQGSPAILSAALLSPCLRAEQLLVTVDTHTGWLHCHVPQHEPHLVTELQQALNGDRSRLPHLVTDLRYWITQRRCEKTLQHLPATPRDRLPLLHHPDHPLTRLSRHRVYVQLHRHPNVVLLVELKEREHAPTEIDCAFHLLVVKHCSIEDNPNDDTVETDFPKVYLRVLSLIELDTFVVTHGPYTCVEQGGGATVSSGVTVGGVVAPATTATEQEPAASAGDKKRTAAAAVTTATTSNGPAAKRPRHPAYFIPELAHVVAMCDERLPFVPLAEELVRRDVYHQGVQVEANATCLVLRLTQLPPPSTEVGRSPAWRSLVRRLLSVSVRVQGKGVAKSWLVELVLYGSPLATASGKEQGLRRPVYFQYDMGTGVGTGGEQAARVVDQLLGDWAQLVHLYRLAHELAEQLGGEQTGHQHQLANLVTVRSYTYGRLVLGYGPERTATVTVLYSARERAYRLVFGCASAALHALNAHALMREQLEAHLNQHGSLAQLAQLLHDTHEPLVSVSRLPCLPQLGVHNARPQVPVQTFTVIPQSCTLLRLAYQGMYCLEVRLCAGGLVSLRDGAYSRFDRSSVVDGFTPTQGLKAFLSRYVDESAVSRRRSQSEDDNPPSPVQAALDQQQDHQQATGSSAAAAAAGLYTAAHGHRPPQSPRFHPPLTPPTGSNPHTPASPMAGGAGMSGGAHAFGSSPVTSFNLASPPSLPPVGVQQSPAGALLPHPSPGGGGGGSPLSGPMHSPAGLLAAAAAQAAAVAANSPGQIGRAHV